MLFCFQQYFILCCTIGRNKDSNVLSCVALLEEIRIHAFHISCDQHICKDLVDTENLHNGEEGGGSEKTVQCETFLISVTTCSNFRNMGIKRQVLRKLAPFIDKTKLCHKRKF